jgi:hypothetical protein
MSEEHDRLVSIRYFTRDMLGMKDRGWYYRHVGDPGMPQRVSVGGKPMLSLQACVAYVERLKRGHGAEAPKTKRGPGRPRKLPVMGSYVRPPTG